MAEKPASLVPELYRNRDFFVADLLDCAIKDDSATMEVPIYSLSTKPDMKPWRWSSKDGSRSLEVQPSIRGRATQFDKDVLIYLVSQMSEGLNRGRPDSGQKTVRFTVYDYLIATNQSTSGFSYKRLELALDRLAGTRLKTNIRTGGTLIKKNFGIIDSWEIIEKSENDKRMVGVEVVLSDWIFNSIQAREVLTLVREYFSLRKPLERRLYEMVRKHAGHQMSWKISMALLLEKSGSLSELKSFRFQVLKILKEGNLPGYGMDHIKEDDSIVFFNLNPKDVAKAIAKKSRQRIATETHRRVMKIDKKKRELAEVVSQSNLF